MIFKNIFSKTNSIFILLIYLALTASVYAIEPEEILIVANGDIEQSVELAKYYCKRRSVPKDNIISLKLGKSLADRISRLDYDKKIAGIIREKLKVKKYNHIRCILTVYGVPIKVARRGVLEGKEKELGKLKALLGEKQNKLQSYADNSSIKSKALQKEIKKLKQQIDFIVGKFTDASVDSELSLVLYENYKLYYWQKNKLNYRVIDPDGKTLMVCRLDGPGFEISKNLVDKAIAAENAGLSGKVYIDSGFPGEKKKQPAFAKYDRSLLRVADVVRSRSKLKVVEEKTDGLFPVDSCPDAALYCGWYSLKKYIDAFDFVDGAVGYHLASWEAVDLRDANSTQWCPAMLKDGITATLGAVSEPYLTAFPKPDVFFSQLLDGYSLVEAYYRSKPFNSWQLVLIGDPLYKPFKRRFSYF